MVSGRRYNRRYDPALKFKVELVFGEVGIDELDRIDDEAFASHKLQSQISSDGG